MPRLYLVRHGKAAAGYQHDLDPGLDKVGLAQAEAMADRLAPMGPLPMLTSPLRRARETAAALERRWRTRAVVEGAVAEIPSPTDDLGERHEWLQKAMGATYADLGPRYLSWRTMVLDMLLSLHADSVIVTHFVAINAAIGSATGDDRLMCAPVDNASISVFESDRKALQIIEFGELAKTTVS